MPKPSPQRPRVSFEGFLFDPATAELRTADGSPVVLQPQPTRLLALLIEQRGQLVPREEIRQHLWGDTAVDVESGLHFAVRKVRRALGDHAARPRFIENVPRRGYRFVAPIQEIPAADEVVNAESLGDSQNIAPPVATDSPPSPLHIARSGDGAPPSGEPRFSGPPLPLPRKASIGRNVMLCTLVALLAFAITALHRPPAPTDASMSSTDPFQEIRPEARDTYLRGQFLMQRRQPGDLGQAARLFRQAMALDPKFALPYVGLEAVSAKTLDLEERLRLLGKARQIAPMLPELHFRLGWIELLEKVDPVAARDAFERVLDHRPDMIKALHGAALAHAATGDLEGALRFLDRAIELDPARTAIQGDAAVLYFWAEQPERALVQLERALDLDPKNEDLRWSALNYLTHSGRWREASEQAASLGLLEPQTEESLASLDHWRRGVAQSFHQVIRDLMPSPTSHGGCLAESHLALGNLEEALLRLEQAESEGWPGLPFLGIDPRWDPVRDRPEFQRLMARLHLEDHRHTRRMASTG